MLTLDKYGKVIITISAVVNSGKTRIIKEIIDQLLKTGNLVFDKRSVYDRTTIIEIHGKIIGLASEGDTPTRLAEFLRLFKKYNCDYIVCATKASYPGAVNRTFDEVKRFAKKEEYKIIPFFKPKGEDSPRGEDSTELKNVILDFLK